MISKLFKKVKDNPIEDKGKEKLNDIEIEAESSAPECPVCLEAYEFEGSKRPKSLKCGHSLCGVCFDSIKIDRIAGTDFKRCPTCRNPNDLDVGYNITFVELMTSKFKPKEVTDEMVEAKFGEVLNGAIKICQDKLTEAESSRQWLIGEHARLTKQKTQLEAEIEESNSKSRERIIGLQEACEIFKVKYLNEVYSKSQLKTENVNLRQETENLRIRLAVVSTKNDGNKEFKDIQTSIISSHL